MISKLSTSINKKWSWVTVIGSFEDQKNAEAFAETVSYGEVQILPVLNPI